MQATAAAAEQLSMVQLASAAHEQATEAATRRAEQLSDQLEQATNAVKVSLLPEGNHKKG